MIAVVARSASDLFEGRNIRSNLLSIYLETDSIITHLNSLCQEHPRFFLPVRVLSQQVLSGPFTTSRSQNKPWVLDSTDPVPENELTHTLFRGTNRTCTRESSRTRLESRRNRPN